MSPKTYKKGDKRGEILLKKYLELFLKNPCRGPNVASNSIWETGIYPYLLPFNWCICNDHINHKYTKNNEIILHVGQTNVFNYWKQNF